MRILLISDIHANTVALKSVLESAGDVDLIIHAGDIVDYNPWPLEAIEMVQESSMVTVLGNHDRDSATGNPIGYNPAAAVSCKWTHQRLTPEAKRYLLNLPESVSMEIEGIRFFICHGSPRDPVDEYIFPPPYTPRSLLEDFLRKTQAQVLILGHTHVPLIQKFEEGYVINPGGCGQPRDGDPRASYVVLNVEDGKVELEYRRVSYDVDRVSKAILKEGLPQFLAQRLYLGV